MGIAGTLLAFTLTGCGETVDEGPKPFKGSNAPGVDKLLENQGNLVKTGEVKKKPAAETTKPADTKPADTTKPADKTKS
jgi:hypothetical protein